MDSAQDTTLTQRKRHEYTENKLKEEGYDIIAGDTDSFVVIDSFNDDKKLQAICEKYCKGTSICCSISHNQHPIEY